MKKNIHKTSFPIIVFFSFFSFLIMSTECKAQDWSRNQKVEIFLQGQFLDGDEVSADDFEGVRIEVDDTITIGLGVGFNFNNYLNLNTNLFYGSPDIDGKLRGHKIVSDDVNMFGWDVNLDYNILKSRFTPMVTGGIGLFYFDGDVEGNDFDEVTFSYNLGAGFRWDVTNHILIKALYRATWTEIEDTDSHLRLDGINLIIGYIF